MALHVAEELVICIIRAAVRGRNCANMEQDANFVATCDHIEDLARQALRELHSMTEEEERKLAYYNTPQGRDEAMTSDLAYDEYIKLLRKFIESSKKGTTG